MEIPMETPATLQSRYCEDACLPSNCHFSLPLFISFRFQALQMLHAPAKIASLRLEQTWVALAFCHGWTRHVAEQGHRA